MADYNRAMDWLYGSILRCELLNDDEWWRIRDLNPGPTDYDSAALTTELIRHVSERQSAYSAFCRKGSQDRCFPSTLK